MNNALQREVLYMQFVADGPDVPPQLLRSLEAGRLVFFVVQVFLVLLGCLRLDNWRTKFIEN